MENIVRKDGQNLSTKNITKKNKLKKLNESLKELKEKKHLCFDCKKDIAKCKKIMDIKKARLDSQDAYPFITEAYQSIALKSGEIKRFVVTECKDYRIIK